MEARQEENKEKKLKTWDEAINELQSFILKAKKEKREPVLLPDFSCHHLRHTFCTRLCENETNLKVIQSIMGHKNIETTLDVYAEATDRKKQEAIENISKLDIF